MRIQQTATGCIYIWAACATRSAFLDGYSVHYSLPRQTTIKSHTMSRWWRTGSCLAGLEQVPFCGLCVRLLLISQLCIALLTARPHLFEAGRLHNHR